MKNRFVAKAVGAAAIALMGLAGQANAGVVFFSGAITTSDPTFINPGGSGTGSALGHYYDVWSFTVDTAGAYIIETASPNTGTTVSNALDTNMRLYSGSFNPLTPSSPAAINSNDDFTGTLTVLPGVSGFPVTSTATGFSGAQPSSRFTTVSLSVGVTYFLVETSFRRIDYVNTTDGGATGPYYGGISGPGNITIPAPASLALMGLGGLVAARRRRA